MTITSLLTAQQHITEYEKLVPCGTDGRLLLSGFRAFMTSTLVRVIRNTVVHQSSSSIYISNFIEIGKNYFVNRLSAGTSQSSRSRHKN